MPCNLQLWLEAAATLPSGRSEIWAAWVRLQWAQELFLVVENGGSPWNVDGPSRMVSGHYFSKTRVPKPTSFQERVEEGLEAQCISSLAWSFLGET